MSIAEAPTDELLEIRTLVSQEVMDAIEQAAALQGRSVDEFISSVLVQAAGEIIHGYGRWRLNVEQSQAFLEDLDTPAEPTPALIEAAEEYQRLVVTK